MTRCGEAARWTASCNTTTRRASAGDTVARTKSARPLCITVDFNSLDDNAVTIRDRDTMEQARIPIAKLDAELGARLEL